MSSSSTAQKKQQKSIPPKRGQIKLQIFENLKTVVSISKVFNAGGKRETSGGSSASATPPASAYNSDGNHGI